MYKHPEKITLENEDVLLTPMKLSDSGPLFKAVEGNDDALFYHMFFGPFRSEAEVEAYIQSQLDKSDDVVFTVYSKRLQRVVGSCSIMNINQTSGGAEIGSIWYSTDAQKTEINTSVVLCVLAYLFEDLRYRRVVWKCDNTNLPSKKAAETLGFRYEGLFRKHLIIKGRNRDTVWYSIIDDEWKNKKQLLEQRVVMKRAEIS